MAKWRHTLLGSRIFCAIFFAMISYVIFEFTVALFVNLSEHVIWFHVFAAVTCVLFSLLFSSSNESFFCFVLRFISVGECSLHIASNTLWVSREYIDGEKKNERTRVLSRWLVRKNCKTYLCNVLYTALHAFCHCVTSTSSYCFSLLMCTSHTGHIKRGACVCVCVDLTWKWKNKTKALANIYALL